MAGVSVPRRTLCQVCSCLLPMYVAPIDVFSTASEFGIPGFPDVKTVDYWLDGNTKDRWAQSKSMAQHDRAGVHERRFAIVMNENFRLTSDFET